MDVDCCHVGGGVEVLLKGERARARAGAPSAIVRVAFCCRLLVNREKVGESRRIPPARQRHSTDNMSFIMVTR